MADDSTDREQNGDALTDAPHDEPKDSDRDARSSRRSFLRSAGIGAAGVVAGGVVGAVIGDAVGRDSVRREIERELGYVKPRKEPGFDHLVVVMFENRSFDNVLGMLYSSTPVPNGQTFNGVDPSKHGNTDPLTGAQIAVHPYIGSTDYVMSRPDPDPGEEYPHVNTQLFGTVDPAANAIRDFRDMDAPFNAPHDDSHPSMDGFLTDYVNHLRKDARGAQPEEQVYRQAMGVFSPEMLPVFSTLARSFAVFDNWHCAVPSQTFCNRSFFHASTSHGFVTNGGGDGYKKWFGPDHETPTIFNRLSDAGLSWCVYFDDRQFISLTGFIHAPSLQQYWKTNFRTMTQFYEDVDKGKLPDYAFVEPRMIYDHNDMHPPVGPMTVTDVNGSIIQGGAISDVRAGEALLHQLYSAVRSSNSNVGSNAMNTMLVVTFDEHGGTYDHVPPPPAVAPKFSGETEMGFGFDRLGVRVPAIAISAYTPAGTVINELMHHGSIIKTLSEKYKLPAINARDREARTIDAAVSLTTARQPNTWPQTHPQYIPPNPEATAPVAGGDDDRPLSPPGVGLTGMLIAHFGGDETQVPRTYREAYDLIAEQGRGLFGSDDAPSSATPTPSATPRE